MKPILILLLLLPLVAEAAGPEEALQNYFATKIAAGEQVRVLYPGDSWLHGDSYGGKNMDPSAGRPYNFSAFAADSSACQGGEFAQYLSRRLGTNKFATLAVGSMEFMIDDSDKSRAQQDSSIFGLMRAEWNELYRPDVVVLPGGGGFNDLFGGDDYATIRRQCIEVAEQSLRAFPDARYVVWLVPRMVGLYNFTRQSGAVHATRRAAAIAEYDTLTMLADFMADSLRIQMQSSGYRAGRFVTFDTRPYAVASGADTTGITADVFYTASSAEHNAIDHLTYSPLRWYQLEADSQRVHLNDFGNRCYADSIAKYLFGIELDDSYTLGAGRTIYMDYGTGHNFRNRMRCTDPAYPLKTLQAAVNQAHPGDIVRVVGAYSHCSTAYDTTGATTISAIPYEVRGTKPGLTLSFAEGASFKAVYDASSVDIANGNASVGIAFLHPFASSDGSIRDSLSHYAADSVYVANALKDLDWKIIGEDPDGNWINGYQTPILYYNYDRMQFENLSFAGGTGTTYSFEARGLPGNVLDIDVTNCVFYVDSATVSGGGRVGCRTFTAATTPALDSLYDDNGFTGDFTNCQFIGSSSDGDESAYEGILQGLRFIGCTWSDPDPDERWSDQSIVVSLADGGAHAPLYFVNCLWQSEESSSTAHHAVYDRNNAADTTYFVNCYLDTPNLSSMSLWDAGGQSAGCEVVVVGSAFYYANMAGGGTLGAGDLQAAYAGGDSTITDGHSTHCFEALSLQALSDTLIYGGVTSWLGYDLTDDFGITHGAFHASMGPTQFTTSPNVILGTSYSSGAAYAQQNLYGAAQLITSGIYPACDSLVTSTWLQVQIPTSAAESAQIDLLIQMYDDLPEATKRDLKLRFVN